MEDYEVFLFDLDGTLIDPKEGITKSLKYALQKMGLPEPQLDELLRFIGPPLMDSFQEFYAMDRETADTAVAYYREHFREKGIYENRLYSDIPRLLQDLKSAGATLVVATSKLTVFSEEILRYFEIDGFFSEIVGSNLDGTRSVKADVIAHAMGLYPQISRDKFVMIGDRKYDIAGAQANEIDVIGVTYGYGLREEFTGAKYLADSVADLHSILLQDK